MLTNKIKTIILASVIFTPYLVFAVPQKATFSGFLSYGADIFYFVAIPLMLGFAAVYFIGNLLKYISSGGDETKLAEAKHAIVVGIISIFVIVSIWGLVNIFVNSFFLGSGNLQVTNIKVLKE